MNDKGRYHSRKSPCRQYDENFAIVAYDGVFTAVSCGQRETRSLLSLMAPMQSEVVRKT